MKYIKFGRSDLEVSRIALGCWQAGKFGWGKVEDEDIIRGIQVGVDELGINFIDTADIYGFGHSEKVVGQAIKGRRDKVVIATKVGIRWDRQNPSMQTVKRDLSKDYILKAVDESLERLQVDVIDLYQCHWPDPETPVEETAEAMEKLCEMGKVRWWGVSNFSVESMKKILELGCKHFVSDQPPYNLLEREIEKDILPFCKENSIAIMAYSPLAMGLLTGKYRTEPQFEGFDWRKYNEFFSGEKFEKVVEAIDKSIHIAQKHGVKFGQIAVAWVLAKGVEVAICGFKNEKQVRENAKAVDVRLSEDEIKELEENFWFAKK